ncbi:MAG: PQQ-binding-like beta-propeller repeat protein, partial [Acidimicrobiales bacterium]
MHRSIATAAAVIALVAGASVLPAAHADADRCDWPMYGRDLGHSFAASDGCTTLSALTAPSISPRWGFPTSDSLTAAPTVVDDVAYAGDWTGAFHAIPVDQSSPAASAAWTFQVDDPTGVA